MTKMKIPDKCLYCGSEDIFYTEAPEIIDDIHMKILVECCSCKRCFYEFYEFQGIEKFPEKFAYLSD